MQQLLLHLQSPTTEYDRLLFSQDIIGYYFRITSARVFLNLHLLKHAEVSLQGVNAHIC